MNEEIVNPPKALELDFSGEIETDLHQVDFQLLERVLVHIPLPSFGVSNSHIDLCSDLLDASWALERLAACAERTEAKIGSGYYKPNITAVLHRPQQSLRDTLADCVLVFMEEDGDAVATDRLQDLRSQIADYGEDLHTLTPQVPDVVDWYLANLIGAYDEWQSEAPEYYAEQMRAFPERQVRYFRSAYSGKLGGDCYASSEGWLVDAKIGVDDFFAGTGQRYRLSEFKRAEIFSPAAGFFVHSDGQLVGFPTRAYFRSQVCAGFAINGDEDARPDAWSVDPFAWLGGQFSPMQTQAGEVLSHGEFEKLSNEGCFLHETGTLVFVNDGRFRHFLYDTKPLSLIAAKAIREESADLVEKLSAVTGISESLKCDWATLSDEEFEQLCYDIIYAHPKFDSDTIRKLGKSRSRDGGRDIEVREVPRWRGGDSRKWIFQCKLITNGSSLGASRLVDVGDMLDHYSAQGFGVMTSVLIDATLYDKLDGVCDRRRIEQYHFSVLELERTLARHPGIRKRYFP